MRRQLVKRIQDAIGGGQDISDFFKTYFFQDPPSEEILDFYPDIIGVYPGEILRLVKLLKQSNGRLLRDPDFSTIDMEEPLTFDEPMKKRGRKNRTGRVYTKKQVEPRHKERIFANYESTGREAQAIRLRRVQQIRREFKDLGDPISLKEAWEILKQDERDRAGFGLIRRV